VIKYLLTFLVLFVSSEQVIAQLNIDSTFTGDSTQTRKKDKKVERVYAIKTIYLLEDSALFKPNHYTHIDTVLLDVDMVDQGRTSGRYLKRINNYGSAAYNLEFSPSRSAGYSLGLQHHTARHIKSKDLRYYNSYTPYTQFRYIQGDGELQALSLYHSQSFGERTNLGITYNSLKSSGFYLREANRLTNVALQLNYASPGGKYQALAYAIWNTNDLNENGGIEDLQDFNTEPYQSQLIRTSQPTSIPNRTGNNSVGAGAVYWLRNMEAGIRQFRYIGSIDSVPGPKKKSPKNAYTVPRAYLTHKLKLSQNISKFKSDTLPAFFPAHYGYVDRYYEVLQHQEVSNQLGLGIFFNKKDILMRDSSAIDKPYPEEGFFGGVDVKLGRTGFWGLDDLTYREPENLVSWWSYANVHIFGNLNKRLTKVTHLKANVDYVAVGSQFSDYDANLKLSQGLWKGLSLHPYLRTQAVSPTGISQAYSSAMAKWVTDFKKQFNNEIGATMRYKSNNAITLAVKRTDNFLYFDELAQPAQSGTGLNYIQLKLRKDFHLGKFHFLNEIAWQQINETSPYTLPTWLVNLHYFFETPMFEKATTVRLGARLFYYSEFEGQSYMPGIAQFHVGEGVMTGGYPQLDLYVEAALKRWNGFVKYEHANDGLLGYDYEMLPGYPMAPRAVRMGVAWRFFD